MLLTFSKCQKSRSNWYPTLIDPIPHYGGAFVVHWGSIPYQQHLPLGIPRPRSCLSCVSWTSEILAILRLWPFWDGEFTWPELKGCVKWPTQRLGIKRSRIESPGACAFFDSLPYFLLFWRCPWAPCMDHLPTFGFIGKYSLHGAFGMLRKNPFLPSLKATAKAPENNGGYKGFFPNHQSFRCVCCLFQPGWFFSLGKSLVVPSTRNPLKCGGVLDVMMSCNPLKSNL